MRKQPPTRIRHLVSDSGNFAANRAHCARTVRVTAAAALHQWDIAALHCAKPLHISCMHSSCSCKQDPDNQLQYLYQRSLCRASYIAGPFTRACSKAAVQMRAPVLKACKGAGSCPLHRLLTSSGRHSSCRYEPLRACSGAYSVRLAARRDTYSLASSSSANLKRCSATAASSSKTQRCGPASRSISM